MQRPGKFFLIDDQKVVMMSLQISAIEHCCSEVAELRLCDYGNCGTSMITQVMKTMLLQVCALMKFGHQEG